MNRWCILGFSSVSAGCNNTSQKYHNAFLFKGPGEKERAISYVPLVFLKVKTGKEDGMVFLWSAYFCVLHLYTHMHTYAYMRDHVSHSNFFLCIAYCLVSALPLECKGIFHICNS